MSAREPLLPAETARFQRKRAAILDAAATLINERGTKGLSLSHVAETVGLSTTSVTYYFRRKDQLASACFERTLDLLSGFVDEAIALPTPRERVRRLLSLNFDVLAEIRRGNSPPFARLNDMRAMPEPFRAALIGRFNTIFRRIRTFFGVADAPGRRALSTARTHVLLENLFHLAAWIDHYSLEDYPRAERRLAELLEVGIAPAGTEWPAMLVPLPEVQAEEGPRNFLQAATKLINELGYRGASVERIASELNVTKGSFYHHLDTKDDLVLACFQRSLGTISSAQRTAINQGGDTLAQIGAVVTTLLEAQLSGRAPLLRTTALEALPPELRAQVIDRQDRITGRFSAMMIDAISEGAIRAVDPVIAGRGVMAMINAAFELTAWAAVMPLDRAVELYASTLFTGLFDD